MTTPRSQLWSACLGNLVEHYDIALFGFLSPFLAPLIFPKEDPMTALILTYAMIPLGMLVRPLGSLVFGRIGDIYGRHRALFLTLSGMSLVSGCIALSPTYAQVGLLAPLIFCLGRILQNFLAAGETIGGALFLLENSSENRHDILSSIYNASTMSGHLIASFGVFLLSSHNCIESGWRWLYLCGCATALFGCLLRRNSSSVQPPIATTGIKSSLWMHRKALLFIIIVSGFGSATYSVALILMNGLVPLISTLTKTEIMQINTYLLVFDCCSLPFFGWLASKIPRERLMLSASLSAAVLSIPLFLFLEGASPVGVIIVRMIFVVFGVAFFAPFHAWAAQLVPSNSRYTVISLGYALGSQLLGSPTAALALWCFQQTGTVSSAAWYWMFLGLVSSAALLLASRSKNRMPTFQ